MRSETRSGKKSGQMKFELDSLIAEFKGSTSYLEIGARYGDTFYDVMKSLPKGSLGVVVDLPASLWGSEGTEKYLKEACDELSKDYEIHVFLGSSQNSKIVESVKSFGCFDACLIDGDHRYEGVKADFEAYQPICEKVALHDIVGIGQRHDKNNYVEVPRLWDEIKNDSCKEFIAKGSTMGIGVYYAR